MLVLWNGITIPVAIARIVVSAVFGDLPSRQDLLFEVVLDTLTLVGMYMTRPRTPPPSSAEGQGDAG